MGLEQIGFWVAFVLTLMVFSYLLGDNFLYRLAVFVFVGLAAGFIAVVTVESVILPWLNGTLFSGGGLGPLILGALPLLLGLLLLFKSVSPRLGRLGSMTMALLIGIGAAVAILGALIGTIFPLGQATTSVQPGNEINTFIIFFGVVTTLLYFQYLAVKRPSGRVQRRLYVRATSVIGEIFVVVTLGALYGGAILTSLAIFAERVGFLLTPVLGGG